jgi:hypothetical protein
LPGLNLESRQSFFLKLKGSPKILPGLNLESRQSFFLKLKGSPKILPGLNLESRQSGTGGGRVVADREMCTRSRPYPATPRPPPILFVSIPIREICEICG